MNQTYLNGISVFLDLLTPYSKIERFRQFSIYLEDNSDFCKLSQRGRNFQLQADFPSDVSGAPSKDEVYYSHLASERLY